MPGSARKALIGAGAGVAMLIATWFAAFHVGVVRHADLAIWSGFYGLDQRGRIHAVAHFVARLCDPNPYVYFAAVPVVVALLRRRPRVALAVAVILLGANLTTQLLKPLLAQWRPISGNTGMVAAASWPSGHATAAMSLALSCVLASPARWRPAAAALGAGFAVAVCYAFLTLGWHYPSDVLGGFLVAGTWTLLVVSAILAADARRSRSPRRSARDPSARVTLREALGPPVLVALGAIALAAVVAVTRPHAVVAYARAHEVFMLGAAAIGALGVALATAVMLAVRR